MLLQGFRFKPKLWAVLITVVLVYIFIELGRWQLSRADEKNIRQEQLEQFAKQPAITLPGTLIKLSDYLYREVELRGAYVADLTILIDNKTYQGQAGYHVITPIKLANSTLSVAVNRGWVATGYDRSILPEIMEVSGEVMSTGLVMSPETKTLQLGESNYAGIVWDNFDLSSYQEYTGLTFQPIMIQQTNAIQDGLIRDWSRTDSGAAKNLGYAFQWFSLAVTSIIIFIVLNVRRKSKDS